MVPGNRTRSNGHKLKQRKFCLNIRNFSSSEGGQALDQVTWKGHSTSWRYSFGHGPVQPGLDDPALSTEVGWTISIGACPPQPFCDSAMSRCAEWRIYDARTREAVQTQSQDATAQCYCKAPVAKSLEQLGAR